MDIKQKITWDNYQAELKLMSVKTKEVKRRLLKEGKKAGRWASIIGYPAKVLLAISASGGSIQILSEDESNKEWITILNTIITIIVIILVSAKDSFNFEKKKEKYLLAAKSMDTFHELVRFQSFQVKGMEGDRYETLKELKNMYSEIIQTNQVIQMVESISGDVTPPHEMESQTESDESESLQTAQNSPRKSVSFNTNNESNVVSRSKTNDRNRVYYLQKMLNDIN